ncbi:hypothetical protein U1Q18_052791 [Sarracenia purpurea var. burkii]
MSMGSSSSGVNQKFNFFQNKRCKCGKKAAVCISESETNPGRLYFKCRDSCCNFFAWWMPTNASRFERACEDNRRIDSDSMRDEDYRSNGCDIKLLFNKVEQCEAELRFVRGSIAFTGCILFLLVIIVMVK